MFIVKTLFWVAVLGIGLFLCIKLLPPYIDKYQFQEDLTNLARVVTYAQGKTAEDVRADVLNLAQQRGLPVAAGQIDVSKSWSAVRIEVNYTVRVPVPGHTFNLNFNCSAGNKLITAD